MTCATARMLLGLALFCGTAGLAGAGQDAPPASAPSPATEHVAGLIEQAEAARTRAAALDAEWLDTGDLIQQARAAAADRDWQTAGELASRAKQQGELAVAQAEREQTAWRHRVVQ